MMRIPPMPLRDDRPAGERCEVSLRDHFAAAAVTGLLSNIPRYQLGVIAVQAYDIADEMLRERLRNGAVKCRETVQQLKFEAWQKEQSAPTTQPAPPSVETDGFSHGSRTGQINRTPERESPRRECGESSLRDVPQLDNGRASGGPEPLFTSVLPVSYAQTSEERVDYATNLGTTQPRNGALGEPAAWAVMERDGFGIEGTFTDRLDACDWCDGRQQIVPLYRSPPLTAAEREAVEWCRDNIIPMSSSASAFAFIHADTLRKLLEKLK